MVQRGLKRNRGFKTLFDDNEPHYGMDQKTGRLVAHLAQYRKGTSHSYHLELTAAEVLDCLLAIPADQLEKALAETDDYNPKRLVNIVPERVQALVTGLAAALTRKD
jgi:hypothetical protein